jgi:hypothetical protein
LLAAIFIFAKSKINICKGNIRLSNGFWGKIHLYEIALSKMYCNKIKKQIYQKQFRKNEEKGKIKITICCDE